MSNYIGRLTRLELLRPPARRSPDWSRLSPEEDARYREIEQRTDLVGLDGLTNSDVEEAAHLAEIALGIVPPGTPQPRG